MNTVFKLASYTSESKGKIIEVSLWNEIVNGSPAVIISDGENIIPLTIEELRGMFLSIRSLLSAVDH